MKTIFTLIIIAFVGNVFSQLHWTKKSDIKFSSLANTGANDYWGTLDSGLLNTDFNGKKNFYKSPISSSNDPYIRVIYNNNGQLFVKSKGGGLHTYNISSNKWSAESMSIRKMEVDDIGNLWVLTRSYELKFKKIGQTKFTDFTWPGGARLSSYIGKGASEMLIMDFSGDTLRTVDVNGGVQTIPLDSNYIVSTGFFQGRAFVTSSKKGIYTFYPTQKRNLAYPKYISTYNVSTKTSTSIKVNERDNYNGKVVHLKNNSTDIIFNVIPKKLTQYSTETGSFYILKNGEYKLGNYKSGLGVSLVNDAHLFGNELMVLTNKGVMACQSNAVPVNPDSWLNSNDFAGYFSPNGSLFSNQIDFAYGFGSEGPRPDFQNRGTMVFHAVPWFGAKNRKNKELHISAQRFEQGEEHSRLYVGPISSDYDTYSIPWIQHVTKKEIELHKKNYQASGYKMPTGIRDWPAHGFQKYGQALCLAPFVDVDSDGVYIPRNGDYPKIRGDQAVYCIFNDNKIKRVNDFKNLGIEVHAMYYRFDDHKDKRINNTIFMHYEVINRSDNDYDSLKVGMWVDFDLGCSQDDYIGSAPEVSSFYAYNGDKFDEDCRGIKGFGATPPILAVTALSDSLSSFMYHNGSQSANGDPLRDFEYNYYLNSRWRDGSGLVHGGTGMAISGGTIPSRFMYSGKWKGRANWTETTAGNTPADRRGVGSMGPYSLNSKEILTFDMMYHAVWDSTSGGVLDSLAPDIKFLKTFFANQGFTNNTYVCTGAPKDLSEEEKARLESLIQVFPNPSKGQFVLNMPDDQLSHLRLISMEGKIYLNKIVRLSRGENPIDVSHLAPGIYLLKLSSDEIEYSHRVVIQE